MSDNLTLPKWEIIHGDALSLLRSYPAGSFDAIITDPPYASGGRTQAEKNKSTAQKYSSMGENAPPAFDGDAKDQRSFTSWCAEWLSECRRIAKPGAPLCVFIDWRQLPSMTDAIQWAGWIWRGTAVWDKGNSLPRPGRVHRLGFQRGYAHLPARALSARCVQIRQPPKPHSPDRKAPTAHAGYRPHHRTGRPYP